MEYIRTNAIRISCARTFQAYGCWLAESSFRASSGMQAAAATSGMGWHRRLRAADCWRPCCFLSAQHAHSLRRRCDHLVHWQARRSEAAPTAQSLGAAGKTSLNALLLGMSSVLHAACVSAHGRRGAAAYGSASWRLAEGLILENPLDFVMT